MLGEIISKNKNKERLDSCLTVAGSINALPMEQKLVVEYSFEKADLVTKLLFFIPRQYIARTTGMNTNAEN